MMNNSNKSGISRRDALKLMVMGLGAAVGGKLLSSCTPPPLPGPTMPDPPPPCEPSSDDAALDWAPNVYQPVFYGYADYNPSVGAPTNLRVYYPTADGSPQCAPFLAGPGHFPLVMFLHGQCIHNSVLTSESFHYTKWSKLPTVLARSGFIVAIPDLTGISDPTVLSNDTYTRINNVITWMRSSWSHSQFIMEPPTLGIVGHSYGAMHGGQLALTIPATVYVSLSGPWGEWPLASRPLTTLSIPKLLVWGTTELQPQLSEEYWTSLPRPKHRLIFAEGDHWDYVPPSETTCDQAAGPCDLVFELTADFIAMFISKYMSPEEAPLPRFLTDDNLVRPSVSLTPEQQFFASGHLTSFDRIGTHEGCNVTLTWATPDGSGTRSLP